MNTRVHDIAMAALLHDIGKFWSRTGEPKPYDEQNKANFGDTYLHALWSGTFIEQYIGDADIARWVRNHHKPSTREELLISLADHLASGERYTDDDLETGRAQDAALVHILTSVRLEGAEAERGYLPLVHHGAFSENAFMPRESFEEAARCYPDLWAGFAKAAKEVRPESAPMETWLALLRRFASRIPAATPTRVGANVPDISLYEHSRVTAAIAACLTADERGEKEVREWRTNFDTASFNPGAERNKEVFGKPLCRLVCGDLSGIQEFLYAIPRKGAAKTLRARSFALQLVASACAEFVCAKAGVPPCNIIYSGGGRFYLLLPEQAVPAEIARALDTQVQDHFGGALVVVIGDEPLCLGDFLPGNFSKAWRKAGECCAEKKARKFSERARTDYEKVFGLMDAFVPVVSSAPGGDSESELADVAIQDMAFLQWGRMLTRARWLVKTEPGDHPLSPGDINLFFRRLGFEYHLVPEGDTLSGLPRALELCELNRYDPYNTQYALKPRGNTAFTYRLAATQWPQFDNGATLTFEEIAQRATGAQKLAVFRADVDNLGQVFTRGLGERATAGRVAMLSQAMADFFEGYLNWLCTQEPFYGRLGVIYAGGDDLFIVGAWDAILDFAVELREAFARYAFNNPAFSLSGGIVLVDDHLPVRHFAELAGAAEDKAKGHQRKQNDEDKEKDALTFFDMPFGREELPRFLELKDLLLDALQPGVSASEAKRSQKTGAPVPMGFLRRLFEVWDTYLQEREERERQARAAGTGLDDIQRLMHWQRWRWMLVYGLRDYMKKANGHGEAIEAIQQRILDVDAPVDDRLGMPLRWVELLLKKDTVRKRPGSAATDERNSEPETATTTERE